MFWALEQHKQQEEAREREKARQLAVAATAAELQRVEAERLRAQELAEAITETRAEIRAEVLAEVRAEFLAELRAEVLAEVRTVVLAEARAVAYAEAYLEAREAVSADVVNIVLKAVRPKMSGDDFDATLEQLRRDGVINSNDMANLRLVER